MGSGSSTQVKTIKSDLNNHSVNQERKQQITQMGTSGGQDRVRSDLSRRRLAAEKEQAMACPNMFLGKSETAIKNHSSEVQHLEARIKELEKEIGKSESEKLDLRDQIEHLEGCMAELRAQMPGSTAGLLISSAVNAVSGGNHETSGLQETVRAKDQYIDQLERELVTVKNEAHKMRVRLKKRIKALTSELNVTKQEASIAQMELKDQLHNYCSKAQGKGAVDVASASTVTTESTELRNKVILDLSLQVCEQTERISQLEKDLQERDEELLTLRNEVCVGSSQRGNLGSRPQVSGSLPHDVLPSKNPGSGSIMPLEFVVNLDHGSLGETRAVGPGKPGTSVQDSSSPRLSEKHQATASPNLKKLVNITRFQRQSTTLSDSDSDWEMDKSVSSTKIRSAPPRVPAQKRSVSADKDSVELASAQEAWTSLHCAVDRSFLGTDVTPFML